MNEFVMLTTKEFSLFPRKTDELHLKMMSKITSLRVSRASVILGDGTDFEEDKDILTLHSFSPC